VIILVGTHRPMIALLLLLLVAAAMPPTTIRSAPAPGAIGAPPAPAPGDSAAGPEVADPIDPRAPSGLLDRMPAAPQPFS